MKANERGYTIIGKWAKVRSVMVRAYSDKATPPEKRKKARNKNEKRRGELFGNCVWLSGRMYIEERRTIERRAAASVKAKNPENLLTDQAV